MTRIVAGSPLATDPFSEMDINRKSPVAEVAAAVRGAASVFESFGIDYSCAGGKTIEEAARAEGVETRRLLDALSAIPPSGQRWPGRSLTELARHLVGQHQRLLRQELTGISIELLALCEHGAAPPGLRRLRTLFNRMTERLLPHFHEEECSTIFAIESLEDPRTRRAPAAEERLGQQIAAAVITHGEVSGDLRQLRALRLELERRDLPERVGELLQRLAWLEANLHEYMFLENCILLPRAIALHESQSSQEH